MALDRINFLPRRRSRLSIGQLPPPEILVGGTLACVLLVLVALTCLKARSAYALAAEIAVVEKAGASMKQKVTELMADKSGVEAAKRTTAIQTFAARKYRLSDLLKEMSLIIPERTWLVSFVTKKLPEREDVLIAAEAPSSQHMGDFLQALESSFYFRDARFDVSERLGEGRSALFRFQFKAAVSHLQFARAGGPVK